MEKYWEDVADFFALPSIKRRAIHDRSVAIIASSISTPRIVMWIELLVANGYQVSVIAEDITYSNDIFSEQTIAQVHTSSVGTGSKSPKTSETLEKGVANATRAYPGWKYEEILPLFKEYLYAAAAIPSAFYLACGSTYLYPAAVCAEYCASSMICDYLPEFSTKDKSLRIAENEQPATIFESWFLPLADSIFTDSVSTARYLVDHYPVNFPITLKTELGFQVAKGKAAHFQQEAVLDLLNRALLSQEIDRISSTALIEKLNQIRELISVGDSQAAQVQIEIAKAMGRAMESERGL